jgi:hypothetical protein
MQLHLGQLKKLALLFLSRPLYIIPTISATKKTLLICDRLYKNSHHKSNKANAFRHALWNVLICKKVIKYAKNKQKSVFWAQKAGDLHEKVTRNEILDQEVDLQNNTTGRIFFLNHLEQKEAKIIDLLQKMSQKAQKTKKIEQIRQHKNELVYLTE